MKKQLTIISDDLNHNIITEKEARDKLLILFGVRESLVCGRFSISEHPPIPDTDLNGTRNVIWMQTNEGEGTTIDVEKLFEWAM